MKRGPGPKRRTPLKRTTPLPRRKSTLQPRKPIPGGRTRPKEVYPTPEPSEDRGWAWQQRRMALFTRSKGRCEVCGRSLAFTGLEAHHRRLKGRRMNRATQDRLNHHRLSNLLAVCAPCHEDIHAHPRRSMERGHMIPSLGHVDVEPTAYAVILHTGRTVRLTDDGEYDEVFPAPEAGD